MAFIVGIRLNLFFSFLSNTYNVLLLSTRISILRSKYREGEEITVPYKHHLAFASFLAYSHQCNSCRVLRFIKKKKFQFPFSQFFFLCLQIAIWEVLACAAYWMSWLRENFYIVKLFWESTFLLMTITSKRSSRNWKSDWIKFLKGNFMYRFFLYKWTLTIKWLCFDVWGFRWKI